MKRKPVFNVAIVEDDVYYNNVLTKYVKSVCSSSTYPDYMFTIKSYTNPEDFLEDLHEELHIVILDYYLVDPESDDLEINGEDIYREIDHHCTDCKVIMISEQDNMSKAVDLMKDGVYDYIDKNANSNNRLANIIDKIIKENKTVFTRVH